MVKTNVLNMLHLYVFLSVAKLGFEKFMSGKRVAFEFFLLLIYSVKPTGICSNCGLKADFW